MNFQNKNGDSILLGEIADLKIDTNRRVYVKAKDSMRYDYIDYQIPVGWKNVQKRDHLEKLHDKIKEHMGVGDEENQNEME
jgi:hypothetical protein